MNGKYAHHTRKLDYVLLTGGGKSTLANVLSGTNDFKESSGSISETRKADVREFKINGLLYKLIDTVGIGDTQLTTQEVLNELAEAAHSMKDGLNQILFVASGRFTKEEVEAYDLLRAIIFDKNVIKYTTIVRTNFSKFENVDECQNDREKLFKENEKLAAVINGCRDIIYIDNPPLDGRSKEINKTTRDESRKRLLLYLFTCKDIYKPKNLDKLNERIGEYMTEKEILEQMVNDMKEQHKKIDEKMKKADEEFKNKIKEMEEKMRNDREEAEKKMEDMKQAMKEKKLKLAEENYELKLKLCKCEFEIENLKLKIEKKEMGEENKKQEEEIRKLKAKIEENTKEHTKQSSSDSETRKADVREFKINGLLYKLIDTVGIGDTHLTLQEVFNGLAEALIL
nr:2640_t:CDS:2 [Entrophospora candida]